MEKRKVILLAVAGVCIVGAGILLYFNMADTGPKPVPPPPLETILQDPAVKQGYEQQLEFQKQQEKKGISPAGS
ncbi:MAG TPA: hypothetical protein VHN77_12080 [Phycisphaerales bacterium]|nr:hypothetical protein [Phycisphaerales bacterium]